MSASENYSTQHEPIEIDYSKTQSTVCYLVKDGKILLVEKGRNIGKGKLVGVGGRQEEIDSTLSDTSDREVEEEIGVKVISKRMVAILDFVFPQSPNYSQTVTAFIADKWIGAPKITEEAKSIEWYCIDQLPIERMWHDNTLWLPLVLAGKEIKGRFAIGEDNRVIEYTLEEIKPTHTN